MELYDLDRLKAILHDAPLEVINYSDVSSRLSAILGARISVSTWNDAVAFLARATTTSNRVKMNALVGVVQSDSERAGGGTYVNITDTPEARRDLLRGSLNMSDNKAAEVIERQITSEPQSLVPPPATSLVPVAPRVRSDVGVMHYDTRTTAIVGDFISTRSTPVPAIGAAQFLWESRTEGDKEVWYLRYQDVGGGDAEASLQVGPPPLVTPAGFTGTLGVRVRSCLTRVQWIAASRTLRIGAKAAAGGLAGPNLASWDMNLNMMSGGTDLQVSNADPIAIYVYQPAAVVANAIVPAAAPVDLFRFEFVWDGVMPRDSSIGEMAGTKILPAPVADRADRISKSLFRAHMFWSRYVQYPKTAPGYALIQGLNQVGFGATLVSPGGLTIAQVVALNGGNFVRQAQADAAAKLLLNPSSYFSAALGWPAEWYGIFYDWYAAWGHMADSLQREADCC
jgi:hypothetical protein